jgi:hypothetical protein
LLAFDTGQNLTFIFDKKEGVDWIQLAQDGDKWRDLANVIMNLRVP